MTKMRAAGKEEAKPETYNVNFKARAVPKAVIGKATVPPRPAVLEITEPEEFHLTSVARHEQYQKQLQEKLQKAQAAAKEAANFKAKPIQHKDKFVCDNVEHRPLTEVEEFMMPGRFFHAHAQEELENKKREAAEKAADMVALNAGAALYVAGISSSLKQGVALAQDVIASGQALEKMRELASFSQELR